MAEDLLANGYRPPKMIAGYTADGVPFIYPPLGFYSIAALLDIGLEPLLLTRVLPSIISVAVVIPFYFIARNVLGTPLRAGITAILFAVTPTILQWHISAGGIVRAPAFLFTISGLYSGLRVFQYHHRRWIASTAILFGLTLLTHPTYSIFFGASCVLLYLRYDRSIRGLAMGVMVAIGGFLLASPWILYIVSTTGIEGFTAAASTHGGIVQTTSLLGLLSILGQPIAAGRTMSLWYLLVLLGSGYLIAQRRFFLPVWFLLSILLLQEKRFAFVPGIIAIGALTTASRYLQSNQERQNGTQWLSQAMAVGLIVMLFAMGGLYVAGSPLHGGTSQPSFIDNEDMAAMDWVKKETATDAEFIVMGDAAEWFPYFADRTILVSPWGVEWDSSKKYKHQLREYRQVSRCHIEMCLSRQFHQNNIRPDYVYVPKGTYTVRGFQTQQRPQMRRSLIRSEEYQLAYENQDVIIFKKN
ncbi:glycosyltransferase family 39 protein [Haladaptatus pallidirubidus]|nr:glycosyltransferase family 39 protein [Haladaptatus pallidirubidus]